MRSGFLDLILIPVQFNSIRPPGSRSGLVLKRDVIACSRPSDYEDGANRYKQEKKNSGLPLCLLIFFPALLFRAALEYLNARNKFKGSSKQKRTSTVDL